jgi:hypothetical protein
MRIILTLWFLPLALFWSWYGLSAYDISFGTVFFSRELHDLIFQIYGQTLGMPPEQVPAAIAGACAFDTAIVFGIAAWRWRASWVPQARQMLAGRGEDVQPIEAAGIMPAPVAIPQSGSVRPAE